MDSVNIDSYTFGLFALRASQWEAEHVLRQYSVDLPVDLSDAFGDMVAWAWRNRRMTAIDMVASLIANLRGKLEVDGLLIEAVLGALPMVLHPVEGGEADEIVSSLRPDVVARLGAIY
ncbi:hypothetical protein [Actinoplanes sp. URMC 104]|uniref:hypothetical protein n=1 Tax=Actinoplanes sp. URMC 104 TaxID=3423409 RepID=UPI003F1CE811